MFQTFPYIHLNETWYTWSLWCVDVQEFCESRPKDSRVMPPFLKFLYMYIRIFLSSVTKQWWVVYSPQSVIALVVIVLKTSYEIQLFVMKTYLNLHICCHGCRVFSDGGNFCPEEIDEYRKRLDKQANSVDKAEGAVMSDLEDMESKRLEQATKVALEFEDRYENTYYSDLVHPDFCAFNYDLLIYISRSRKRYKCYWILLKSRMNCSLYCL